MSTRRDFRKNVLTDLEVSPSTLGGAPAGADGQLVPVTDIPGKNLYVRKGGVLVPVIESAGGTVLPFSDVAEVDVYHNLGRRPMVQILKEETSGMFGFGGFGGGGFGSSTVQTIMNAENYSVYHLDENYFKLVMNDYYNGEILYT
jgi:hypothetical protein